MKPKNVLMTSQGICKLADFGSLTRTGFDDPVEDTSFTQLLGNIQGVFNLHFFIILNLEKAKENKMPEFICFFKHTRTKTQLLLLKCCREI